MKDHHAAPFEHCAMTVVVEAPIFVFREWHRHRTQSFSEMSGRYVELPGVFYIPAEDRPVRQEGKAIDYDIRPDETTCRLARQAHELAARTGWDAYQAQLKSDVAKEVARMCLPLNTYSRMWATANLRNWFNFLQLRTRKPDHQVIVQSKPMYEINVAANMIENLIIELWPWAHEAWVAAKRPQI
jgi:thymidylate synthase (FAD)